VLRDRRGAVVVVFDAEKGTAEISAPSGDLVLSAPSGRIALRASEVLCEAGKIEVRAERLVERVRDVYLEVEGLVHTRADRVRTLARDVFQVFAKRASVVAEDDASIDGKRVLLG
jgi:proline racemase